MWRAACRCARLWHVACSTHSCARSSAAAGARQLCWHSIVRGQHPLFCFQDGADTSMQLSELVAGAEALRARHEAHEGQVRPHQRPTRSQPSQAQERFNMQAASTPQ